MRIAVLIAASVLVAGCSLGGDAERAEPSPSPPVRTTAATPGTTQESRPTSTPRAQPPGSGAPVGEVIAFIESGQRADPATYHSATRDGTATELGDDIAFTTPTGRANCMTDGKYFGGALACLVDLTNPPPQPAEVYGQWKGDWVDFAGPSVEVGSAHGDPGRFTRGTGPELPYGHALAFGDYRCRADETGLFCVNYAHRSAVRFSADGVEPYGCLQKVTPPAGIGEKFSC